ncbi:MFS transporter, partial [Mycobacterium sp. ITM-2017-0098]
QFFSWQAIFYAFAAGALLMFALTCTVGSSRDETATPIDWLGASTTPSTKTAIAVPTRGWTDVVVLGCMGAGVVLAVLFALL